MYTWGQCQFTTNSIYKTIEAVYYLNIDISLTEYLID